MSSIWLPPDSDIARAARGWPAPGVIESKPTANISQFANVHFLHQPSALAMRDYWSSNACIPAGAGLTSTDGLYGDGSSTAYATSGALASPSDPDFLTIAFEFYTPNEITINSGFRGLFAFGDGVTTSVLAGQFTSQIANEVLTLNQGTGGGTAIVSTTISQGWHSVVFIAPNGSRYTQAYIDGSAAQMGLRKDGMPTVVGADRLIQLFRYSTTEFEFGFRQIWFSFESVPESFALDWSRSPRSYLEPANDTPYLISLPTAPSTTPTLSTATFNVTGQTTATVGCTATF